MATHKILVGSYTDSIHTLEFDPVGPTPTLNHLTKVNVGDHPSWIEAHPSDRSLIFACLEQAPDGQIVVVKYDENGNGHKIEEATCRSSGGAHPCTLSITENELLIENYSGGTMATVPISARPPYARPAELWTLAFPFEAGKTGRNPSRQEASHPHQTVFNPLNSTEEEVLVPDLGADKIWRLTRGSDSRWAIQGFVSVETGGGPRHVAIHEHTLYVLLELTSELAAYEFRSARQSPTHLSTVSTLRQSPTPAGMIAAEILIPRPNRSFPTAYIYTSNRGDPHPEGDTIAIFSLERGEGHPELVTEVRTGLRHVRAMAFGGDDDKWLVVGGVGKDGEGGGIKIFGRIEGGKELQQIAELDDAVGSEIKPTSFIWI